MILVIDNYDSFVHNLARYVRLLGAETRIERNDALSVAEVLALDPEGVILSPGPRTPNEAGLCLELIRAAGMQFPILGICLGHQAIGQAYGATVRKGYVPVHGKASLLHHDGRGIFSDIPSPVSVGRYHSLVIDLPAKGPLVATGYTEDGHGSRTVMAVAHQKNPHIGFQFHPESVLTNYGSAFLANFWTLCRDWRAARASIQEAAQ